MDESTACSIVNEVSFSDLNLNEGVVENLTEIGFLNPTEIQRKAIPLVLEGFDILASSKTGSGKTGAFGIPIISNICKKEGDKALILAPTRELAVQIKETLVKIKSGLKINICLVFGGSDMKRQIESLKRGPEIIVATPGRLKDHLERKTVNLKEYNLLVLDEFDRMLEMGFKNEISAIISNLPEERQTLMFSATTRDTVIKEAKKYLKNYKEVILESAKEDHKNIEQRFEKICHTKKYESTMDFISKARNDLFIIFVNTKYKAKELSDDLRRSGFSAKAIHGDLTQKERMRSVDGFKQKQFNILVATDVVARGLDIDDVKFVLNYDMPKTPEDYTHRIGRTGRGSATGISISFVTDQDHKIHKAILSKDNSDNFEPEFKNRRGGSSFGRGRGNFGGGSRFSNRRGDNSRFSGGSNFSRGKREDGERNFNSNSNDNASKGSFFKKRSFFKKS